jgi:hypothetical protein
MSGRTAKVAEKAAAALIPPGKSGHWPSGRHRRFLDGLGVPLGSDYLCFNAAGDVIESGQQFVLMSADVNTVNNALHAGSKPGNLVMGPAAFFTAAPTSAGLGNPRVSIWPPASAGADCARSR